MNIFQRMSNITSDLNSVAKNLKVGEGRNSYKAVSEADVLAVVKPIEAKHGVYSYPVRREIIDSDVITTKKTYNGDTTESSRFFMRVHTVYRFVNVEKPDEFVDIDTYGDGIDSGDKAPGKAMTYGDKYALLKAYKIITGDDPDQQASEPDGYKRPTAPVCEDCGCAIQGVKSGSATISASEIAERSKKTYGKALCLACANKAKESLKNA